MFELHLGNGIADVLVTFNTEGVSRLKESEFVIGSMRVVAFYAIPFPYNFMGTLGTLWQNTFMALKTNLIRFFIQQLSVGSSMRIMAF